jgi:hypothetical protein
MKLLLLALLVPACCFGHLFQIAWDPSPSPGIKHYIVLIAVDGGSSGAYGTTPSTSWVVDLETNSYTVTVKAVGTNGQESLPSNAWRIPKPAGTVQGSYGVWTTTNAP